MDVSFSSAALAALCNSEHRLVQRFGPRVGRTITCRLLDLTAVDGSTVDRLPEASVSINGSGETTITFADEFVIHGLIRNSEGGARNARADAEHMVIASLEVHGSDQR